jgi:hypothetical protein
MSCRTLKPLLLATVVRTMTVQDAGGGDLQAPGLA